MKDSDLTYWHKLQCDLRESTSWTPEIAASWAIARSQLDQIAIRVPLSSGNDYPYYLEMAQPIVAQHILRMERIRQCVNSSVGTNPRQSLIRYGS